MPTFGESLVRACAAHAGFKLSDRLLPLILQHIDLLLKLFVLSIWNLHDWTLGDNFFELCIEISGDALSQVDGAFEIILVLLIVVEGAHATQDRKDALYCGSHLFEVHSVEQFIDRDVLQ